MTERVLDGQDAARARDRERVVRARRDRRRGRLMWLLVGPGVLAMLGENDGPSMISYAAAGASYGLGFFLPLIVALFAMAFVCQEMGMRVAAVTHRGYGTLVLARYGPVWGWFGALDLVATNLVTLIAEFVAIRVGLAYFGLGAPVAAGLGVALVVATLTGRRYWRWERVVLGLAVFNGLFLLAAIGVKPDPGALAHALATFTPLPGGDLTTVLLLVASTIGATVTPWMVFFQMSGSADKGLATTDIGHGRLDTGIGAGAAAVFSVAALVAGAALARPDTPAVRGLAGAGFPAALASLSPMVATVFALGLIEAGAVAVLTISASTAYAAAECLGVSASFNTTPRRARVFYTANGLAALIAAVVILIPGVPLLAIALNANVLATVLAPVALIFLLLLACDRELMGRWANRPSTTVAAIVIIALVALGGGAYAIDSFLQTIHLLPAPTP